MGLLIEHTLHDKALPHWHELSLAIAQDDGELYEKLDLAQRELVYQAVLDAIRSQAGERS